MKILVIDDMSQKAIIDLLKGELNGTFTFTQKKYISFREDTNVLEEGALRFLDREVEKFDVIFIDNGFDNLNGNDLEDLRLHEKPKNNKIGVHLAKEIKRRYIDTLRNTRLYLVISTAYKELEDSKSYLRAGVFKNYITKTDDAVEIQEIKQVLADAEKEVTRLKAQEVQLKQLAKIKSWLNDSTLSDTNKISNIKGLLREYREGDRREFEMLLELSLHLLEYSLTHLTKKFHGNIPNTSKHRLGVIYKLSVGALIWELTSNHELNIVVSPHVENLTQLQNDVQSYANFDELCEAWDEPIRRAKKQLIEPGGILAIEGRFKKNFSGKNDDFEAAKGELQNENHKIIADKFLAANMNTQIERIFINDESTKKITDNILEKGYYPTVKEVFESRKFI